MTTGGQNQKGRPVHDETHTAERPATFREVFGTTEYRAVFLGSSLSWVGDYLARAAVTALVYRQTGSVAMSAATFAISYLPWIAGGPVLSAIAERHSYRSVMVICDIVRAMLIALVAVPRIPIWAILALLFATAMLNPPFDAARSALLPRILHGDRYVLGLSLQSTTRQAVQIGGYLTGAALGYNHPHLALFVDAVTFAFSAFLVGLWVRARSPALTARHRTHLLRETAEGYQLVFGNPVLRAIAVVSFASMLFAVVPEALAAAWAALLAPRVSDRGWVQGLIMVANPLGFIVGGLLIGRLVAPAVRRRLIRPFAVLIPAALVPALINPSAVVVAVMAAVCGFAVAGMIPAANGLFVQALPDAFRARAFGVMQSGVQICQGVAVLVTGTLADRYPLPVVVGLWSLLGVAIMVFAGASWPASEQFSTATATAREMNAGNATDRTVVPGTPAARRPGDPAAPAGPSGPAAQGPGAAQVGVVS
ncbi:MAG TPA: MFS transporter [Micromonosporaceae bacterium]